MTKAVLWYEFEEILERTTLTKKGAYDALMKYIFDWFEAEELEALLNHIKEEIA